MRAIGYVRVSTDHQVERGVSLEAQRSVIAEAARRQGADLVGVYEDAGLSGSLGVEHRPGLLDAITALKRGDVLIVAKRDRLGRDVIAVAMIERFIARRGARVVSRPVRGPTPTIPRVS